MVRALEAGGSIRFPYRELLTELSGSTGFVNQAFALNPGDVNTFPFLSKIAQYFTEYEFEKLCVVFKSQSADALNSTNTALGSVHMATNYNALEPAFTSEAQVLVTPGVTCSKPSVDSVHYIDVMPRNGRKSLFIRSSAVYGNADERLDDLGTFQISTAGMQAVSDIGKAWIEYDVILRKPRLAESGSTGAASYLEIHESFGGTATAAAPLGTTGGAVSLLSTIPSVTTTTSYTLPYQGYYLLTHTFTTSNANIGAAPTASFGVNIAGQSKFKDFAVGSVSTYGSTTAVNVAYVYVSIPGTGAANTVTIGGLTGMTGGMTDIFVASVPGSYTLRKLPTDERLRALIAEVVQQRHSELVIVDEPADDDRKLPSPCVPRRR